MKKELGSILLIAGCCIGAGMLGLPIITGPAGFIPTLALFLFAWAFMVVTGLLFLELTLSYDRKRINLVTMSRENLGKIGQWAVVGLFCFLFYAILVAYVVGSGGMLVDFMKYTLNIDVPLWLGSLLLVCVLLGFLLKGASTIDVANRWMMFGLVICYIAMIVFGSSEIDSSKLAHRNWYQSMWVMPIMIISFGYHNMIPSLAEYLNGNPKKLIRSILIGAAIPLFIYLIWEAVILGLLPLDSPYGILAAQQSGEPVTHLIYQLAGAKKIIYAAQGFAFFAIVTSFLGVALSFVDFMADAFQVSGDKSHRLKIASLVILPPFFASLAFPHIFLSALNYAGGIGAVSLFGLIPAIMVWRRRYSGKISKEQQILGGGRVLLVSVIAVSLVIMGIEIINEMYT